MFKSTQGKEDMKFCILKISAFYAFQPSLESTSNFGLSVQLYKHGTKWNETLDTPEMDTGPTI